MRLRLFDEIEARLSRVRLVDDRIVYHRPLRDDDGGMPGVTAINHVGLWNDNTSRLTQMRPLNPPAVFVEFIPATRSQLGRDVIHADLTVRLQIVTATLAATDTPWRDEALARFRLIRAIKAAFVRFSGAVDGQGRSFSAFQYLESLTDHNHEQVCEDLEGWRTHCIDASAAIDDGTVITPWIVTLDTGDIFDCTFAVQMV